MIGVSIDIEKGHIMGEVKEKKLLVIDKNYQGTGTRQFQKHYCSKRKEDIN